MSNEEAFENYDGEYPEDDEIGDLFFNQVSLSNRLGEMELLPQKNEHRIRNMEEELKSTLDEVKQIVNSVQVYTE